MIKEEQKFGTIINYHYLCTTIVWACLDLTARRNGT